MFKNFLFFSPVLSLSSVIYTNDVQNVYRRTIYLRLKIHKRGGEKGKFCDERHNKNFIYNDNARWIEILKACHNFE